MESHYTTGGKATTALLLPAKSFAYISKFPQSLSKFLKHWENAYNFFSMLFIFQIMVSGLYQDCL